MFPCTGPERKLSGSKKGLSRALWSTTCAYMCLIIVHFALRVRGFPGVHELGRRCPVWNATVRDCDFLLHASRRAYLLYIKRLSCLHYSAAVCCLLRLHGVKASLVIGVRQRPFGAHAWVELNKTVLVSSEDVSPYQVIERI
jgi:hypothetical protein